MPTPPKRGRKYILEQRIAQGQRDIRKILLKARTATEQSIIKAAASGNFATSAFTRDTLYKTLGKQYQELGGDLQTWAMNQTRETAREWYNLSIEDIKPGTYRGNWTWSKFSKKYLTDIAERINPMTAGNVAGVNAAIGGMLTTDIRNLRSTVLDVRRTGAASGWTSKRMKAEMLERVTSKRPAWQFIDKAGRRWESKNYFDMLNRTLTAQVSRETYLTTMAETQHDLMTIEGGITDASMRIPSDPCPEWAGQIISMNGATKGYPTLADAEAAGMFHPRCVHYLAVVLEEIPGEIEQAKKTESELADRAKSGRKAEERKREAAKKARQKAA